MILVGGDCGHYMSILPVAQDEAQDEVFGEWWEKYMNPSTMVSAENENEVMSEEEEEYEDADSEMSEEDGSTESGNEKKSDMMEESPCAAAKDMKRDEDETSMVIEECEQDQVAAKEPEKNGLIVCNKEEEEASLIIEEIEEEAVSTQVPLQTQCGMDMSFDLDESLESMLRPDTAINAKAHKEEESQDKKRKCVTGDDEYQGARYGMTSTMSKRRKLPAYFYDAVKNPCTSVRVQ